VVGEAERVARAQAHDRPAVEHDARTLRAADHARPPQLSDGVRALLD
jgi:hypothetical protein